MSTSRAVLAEAKDAFLGTLRGICDVMRQIVEAARHAVRRDIRRSNGAGARTWHRSAPLTRIEDTRGSGV